MGSFSEGEIRVVAKGASMDAASLSPPAKGGELRVWNDLTPHLSIDRRIKLTGRSLKLLSCLEGRVHPPLPRVQTSCLEKEAEQGYQLRFWETAEPVAEQPARVKGNEKKELHLVLLQNKTSGILIGLLSEQTSPVFWWENGTQKSQSCWCVCVCVCVCVCEHAHVQLCLTLLGCGSLS